MGSATTANNRLLRGGSTPIGIQMASASWLPFDEVTFNEDMMFLAAWSVRDRTTLKITGADFYAEPAGGVQEITAFAGAIEDMCGSPPTFP